MFLVVFVSALARNMVGSTDGFRFFARELVKFPVDLDPPPRLQAARLCSLFGRSFARKQRTEPPPKWLLREDFLD